MELIIIIGLLLGAYVLGYNALTKAQVKVAEAWSGITVQLKRRHDLTPQLVSAVKSAQRHEREIVDQINTTRQLAVAALESDDHGKVVETEAALSGAIRKFFAYAEDNPEITANENINTLQKQLEESEDQIAASRRLYNGNVQALNAKIAAIPTNIIANIHKIEPEVFFELTPVETQAVQTVPKIDL